MTATTQTHVIWRPAPPGPPPIAPVPQTPIYAALLRSWREQGRCLPGERDDEWAQLMHRPAWPATWGAAGRVPAARRALTLPRPAL